MKVLWFTNIVLPELAIELGRAPPVVGGWMSALLEGLRARDGVEVAVATAGAGGYSSKRRVNGTTYYLLRGPRASGRLTPSLYSACEGVLAEFQPDVIHVHGTEEVYGLYTARRNGCPPTLVSIQGLMHVYYRHVMGGLSLRMSAEAGVGGMLAWFRFLALKESWARKARTEVAILRGNRYFGGRTEWDRAHVLAVNPGATYLSCGEVLRPEFYRREWSHRFAAKHTIFCTAASSPHKGFHVVLEALSLLVKEFPDISVRVAGAPWNAKGGFGYYGRFLWQMIRRRGLSAHVTPLPPLTAEEVADELAAASVFVIPSFIENSPNSLAEAMMVGTPAVAALAGGVPSMIQDGVTALGFHPGDAAYLAQCLRRLFHDEDLGVGLSMRAKAEARRRHDVQAIVEDQLQAYRRVASSA